MSEVELSFLCHCLPTQQPPFHFETRCHIGWYPSLQAQNRKASNLLFFWILNSNISKMIWKYTLASILYHLQILLLFGFLHYDRVSTHKVRFVHNLSTSIALIDRKESKRKHLVLYERCLHSCSILKAWFT